MKWLSLLLSVTPIVLLPPSFAENSVRALDHFYVCNGGHPRCSVPLGSYSYHQFAPGKLKDFIAFSDVLPPGPPLIHYQTTLSEIISERPNTNAVAIWGDGAASADASRVWGGFFSARSGRYLGRPVPKDAQLLGVEVDVLNASLPGVAPNQSKVGIEVVGFGNINTAAIATLAEGRGPEGGRFANLLMVEKNTLYPDGTLFGIGPQEAKLGLNLQYSNFKDAAMLLSPNNRIVFRDDKKGDSSIWRDSINNGHLVLTAGPSGLRITNSQNNKNLFFIHEDGSIDKSSAIVQMYWPWVGGLGVVLFGLCITILCLLFRIRRLEEILLGERGKVRHHFPSPAISGAD